ncbi:hypothetical protein BASA81_003690 [Batrachochytrium salamandrivorans]|nr:hypothetical protein BASA81_003690 [Batrachochytrium salamandrivorans]
MAKDDDEDFVDEEEAPLKRKRRRASKRPLVAVRKSPPADFCISQNDARCWLAFAVAKYRLGIRHLASPPSLSCHSQIPQGFQVANVELAPNHTLLSFVVLDSATQLLLRESSPAQLVLLGHGLTFQLLNLEFPSRFARNELMGMISRSLQSLNEQEPVAIGMIREMVSFVGQDLLETRAGVLDAAHGVADLWQLMERTPNTNAELQVLIHLLEHRQGDSHKLLVLKLI